MPAIRYLHTNW